MLKKSSRRQQAPRETQGVSAGGNALRRLLAAGIAIAVLPLLAVGLLLLLRQPRIEQALAQQLAEARAAERALALGTELQSLQARARGLLEALPADAAAAGELLRAGFPEAERVQLFMLSELGTAALEEDGSALRSHIEVDLLRRALLDGAAPPEAYRLEQQWWVSTAVAAKQARADGQRPVLLLTLPQTLLSELLTPGEHGGTWALEQSAPGGRSTAGTVFAGSVAASAVQARQAVAGSDWSVIFSPAAAQRAALSAQLAPPLPALLIVLAAILFGFGLLALLYPRALRAEVERVVAAGSQRSPLQLRVPELAPLARELRKLGMRRARAEPGGSTPAGASPTAAPAGAGRETAGTAALTRAEGAAKAIAEHIFRAYDIRGIAETELDDDTAYRIGAALGTLAGAEGEQTLVLGHDGRSSSARIKALVEKALLQSGRDVVDIGLVPTPLVYYATQRLEASSGIMITGSHNPPEYNGMKMVLKRQTVDRHTVDKVRQLALSGKFSTGSGRSMQREIVSDYLDEVIADVAVATPLRVVVDAGNGATGHVAPTLFEELGCEVVPLYCDVDGRFPNRSPDTSNEDNLSDLIAMVREEEADLGVAFDGDGDRIAVVTGSGAIVRSDMLLMLFAQDVVARNPGADVVYDVKCTRNLAQLITGLGGRAVLWKTGHALMKQKMAETGALLGGEFSGHMFFGERWYGFDDGMYAAARLIEILSAQGEALDTLVARLPTAVSTPEILVPVSEAEKFPMMDRFRAEASFGEGKINDLDGVRVDFRQGWGLLRASNTSAALTARFEAADEAALEEIKGLFRSQLAAVAPELSITF